MTAATQGLTCREVADLVGAHLDGELTPDERVRFEGHLADCPHCCAYLRQYLAAIALAKDAYGAGAVVGGDIPESLVHAILAATGGPRRRP